MHFKSDNNRSIKHTSLIAINKKLFLIKNSVQQGIDRYLVGIENIVAKNLIMLIRKFEV